MSYLRQNSTEMFSPCGRIAKWMAPPFLLFPSLARTSYQSISTGLWGCALSVHGGGPQGYGGYSGISQGMSSYGASLLVDFSLFQISFYGCFVCDKVCDKVFQQPWPQMMDGLFAVLQKLLFPIEGHHMEIGSRSRWWLGKSSQWLYRETSGAKVSTWASWSIPSESPCWRE